MRLFLLPISTRRTLIYCEQETVKPGTKSGYLDWGLNKVSVTWEAWEKAEKGWKRQVTSYGGVLLKRIPFEEWGLKSLPPLTKEKMKEIDSKQIQFSCLYPGAFIRGNTLELLGRLAKERQALHWQRLLYCVIGMPISAPFMLVPVVPNLPFYYLVFRAYCNWKALYGSKTLEYIVNKKLVDIQASPKMDEMYVAGLLHPKGDNSRAAPPPSKEDIDQIQKVVRAQTRGDKEEVMLLKKWNGKLLAEALDLPEIEVERAVEQVEKALAKEQNNAQQEIETKKRSP